MATHDSEVLRRNPDLRVLELEHGRLVFDSASAPRDARRSAAGPGPKAPAVAHKAPEPAAAPSEEEAG